MKIDVKLNLGQSVSEVSPEMHVSEGPRRGVEMVLFPLMRSIEWARSPQPSGK
jgi:hypothetical protein